MAGSHSDFSEAAIANHLFGGNSGGAEILTPPANWYFALFTVAPTDAGGGTEVTGGSYARKLVANTLAEFPHIAAGGTKVNANAIVWPEATANWGTIVAGALFDASTSGNMWIWSDLASSKIINTNDTFRLTPGEFSYHIL